MNKKSFGKTVFIAFLDGIIAVYAAVTLIIALSGGFFLRLGPIGFSISHITKPLLLLLAALILRRIFLGKFIEELFSYIPPVKYGFEVLLIWMRKIERWLTTSLWRGLVVLLILGLFYSAAGMLLQNLPFEHGLLGEYYSNVDFEGEPLLSVRDPSINVQRINREFPEVHEHYSIRWTGFLHAPRTGEYTFSTASDDGSWLYLDGELLVDNGGKHGLLERFGTVELKRGMYPIEIRYAQQEGAARIEAYWIVPAKQKRMLPGEMLYPSESSSVLPALRTSLRFGLIVLKVLGFVTIAVLVLHLINPQTSMYSRIWAILWILGGSFGGEFWLLRKIGLEQLSMSWELLLCCVNFIIILLCLGIPFRKLSLKTVLQNAFLLLLSSSLLLGFFEVVFRTGILDDRGTIWIREKYKKLNDDINAKNWDFANKNPNQFTDIVREKEKPAGVSRVAVLGDSFVWGASIPYDTAWGHKLSKKIQQEYQ
ncbi:MAG: hypothetical protein GY801_12915, partial [bacterium]|nr:hypothetical protein [bacterium]